jgi:hypothetical protein
MCAGRSTDSLPEDVTRACEEAPRAMSRHPWPPCSQKTQILAQERPVVKGRHATHEYLAEQINPVLMFDSTTDMSVVCDDFAFESGRYTFRDTRRGADIEYGKNMHVWRKEGDQCKIFRAMYNADEPVNAQVSVAQASE